VFAPAALATLGFGLATAVRADVAGKELAAGR